MTGVLFRVTRWCRRFVTFKKRLAVGLFDVPTGDKVVVRGIVMIGTSAITLCSSSRFADMLPLVILCSLQVGAGCNKLLIFWTGYLSNLFPFGVLLALAVFSANLSVGARRCWCGVMSGSWQCCGNSSNNPDVR